MSGGPIFPNSIVISGGRTFPNSIYSGLGGNGSAHDTGLMVKGPLDLDSPVELRFHVPPTVPTGTPKLRILSLANATSGILLCTVSSANVAAAASPSGATLTAQAQTTITWGAGANDKYVETKVTLPGANGNDVMVLEVLFQTTGSTLAVNSTHIFSLIWE